MSEQGPASAPARVADKAEPRPYGILGAGVVSALLYSAWLLLPVLIPAGLASPFPLLLQRLRGGLGAAVLATMVAAGLLGAAFSPAQAGLFLLSLVIPGLLLLSKEFHWARRLLDWARARLPQKSPGS